MKIGNPYPKDVTIGESTRPRLDIIGTYDNEGKIVYFGKSLSADCQRCGAYQTTEKGHKFCAHVTCPIATRETKRRNRKRTSLLEQSYIPKFKEIKENEGNDA